MHTGSHKLNNALGQALLAQADGQAPDHRRDRRGPARRRDRDGLRAARPRVRRLHGRRGRPPPGAQRAAHGAARREGRQRRGGRAHAEGGRQRGDPRLGHDRRDVALHHRLGRRPGAVPGARARPAARHRRRGARRRCSSAPAGCPTASIACVGGGSNSIGMFTAFVGDPGVAARSASRPRARGSTPAATARR